MKKPLIILFIVAICTVFAGFGVGTFLASRNSSSTSTTNDSTMETTIATVDNTTIVETKFPAEQNYTTYSYKVIQEYPHDSGAFTQGLIYENGHLYEGTGIEGQSGLRKVTIETGEVVQKKDLDDQYFGEGITLYEDLIYQLTWQSNIGFVYEKDTFEKVSTFSYETEGWGITHDGQFLIMSDGTSTIHFLDPETMDVVRTITVLEKNTEVENLNELEYINGRIYANIWLTDYIVKINPITGVVTGRIDLRGILDDAERNEDTNVLNGIAYDSENDRLFVTGKFWPKLFEIELMETET